MAALTAILATVGITVPIAALVYAMHQRRELKRLAAAAARAWLALDDQFVARRDAIDARLESLPPGCEGLGDKLPRLRHLLEALDVARCAPDPLRTATLERQLRTVLADRRVAAVIDSAEQPLTPRTLRDFAGEIDTLAETYDVAVSLFNLRLSRRPERWIGRCDGLEPLPVVEIYQAAEPVGSDWGAFAPDARIRSSSALHQDDDQPSA